MTEQYRPGYTSREEVFVSPVYIQAGEILQKYGQQAQTHSGEQTVVKSFFCDLKDRKGYSDINLSLSQGKINIVVLRELHDGRAKRRELTLSNNQIVSLRIFEGRHVGVSDQYAFTPTYQGGYDESRMSLSALSHWLHHVSENLAGERVDKPCLDNGVPIVTLRGREALKNAARRVRV